MRALSRLGHAGIPAVAIQVMTAGTIGAGAANATGTIPLDAAMRNCDFTKITTALQRPRAFQGGGTAQITTTGSSATAQVHMMLPDDAGQHFDIGLIQAPRPSSATCGPGDPGTTFTGFDIDASGQADVTISTPLQPGTTGVWVIVEKGNEHNQAPSEFYTSEFVAPV